MRVNASGVTNYPKYKFTIKMTKILAMAAETLWNTGITREVPCNLFKVAAPAI